MASREANGLLDHLRVQVEAGRGEPLGDDEALQLVVVLADVPVPISAVEGDLGPSAVDLFVLVVGAFGPRLPLADARPGESIEIADAEVSLLLVAGLEEDALGGAADGPALGVAVEAYLGVGGALAVCLAEECDYHVGWEVTATLLAVKQGTISVFHGEGGEDVRNVTLWP